MCRWDGVWVQWQWGGGRGSSWARRRAQVCSTPVAFPWKETSAPAQVEASHKAPTFCLFLTPIQLNCQRARWIDSTAWLHPPAAGEQGEVWGAPSPAAPPGAATPGARGVQAATIGREAETYRATEGAEKAVRGGGVSFRLVVSFVVVFRAVFTLFLIYFPSTNTPTATATRTGDEEATGARAASSRARRKEAHGGDGS